jgi:cold shock CspA family protein
MSDSANTEQRPGYIDYKLLPFVKAKVKFYSPEKGFGFVTLLDENGEKTQDAFLPGTKLTQAGYEEIAPGQEITVKHTRRDKGEAVVLVKHPPGYSSDSANNAPVKVKPIETAQNTESNQTSDNSDDVTEEDDSDDQVRAA